MRRRMYCLLPDTDHAYRLIKGLRKCGLSDRHIRVLASEDIPVDGMHKVTVIQKTELARGIRRGIVLGGIAGLLGGLLVVNLPPAGIALTGKMIPLVTTLAGVGFGVMVCALLDCGTPSRELRPFRAHLLMGQILLILDISTNNIPVTGRLIERILPEAETGLIE